MKVLTSPSFIFPPSKPCARAAILNLPEHQVNKKNISIFVLTIYKHYSKLALNCFSDFICLTRSYLERFECKFITSSSNIF